MRSDDPSDPGVHCTVPWRDARPPDLRDCSHAWDRIDVTNTGEVLACCFAQETLGNVHRDGIETVLNGKRRRQLQDDIRHNRLNPGCFNAACMFAHLSVRRPWRVDFPADRFASRHPIIDGEIVCDPAAGDGVMAEGPARYLPMARMRARLWFSAPGVRFWQPLSGRVRVEVLDERGTRHGEAVLKLGWSRRPHLTMAFALTSPLRYHFSFRISTQGLTRPLRFDGLTLSGSPIGVSAPVE